MPAVAERADQKAQIIARFESESDRFHEYAAHNIVAQGGSTDGQRSIQRIPRG